MQYTGQMWLPEANLYYYKARNYAPQLGRFVQPDPIGTAGGINLYAYTGNDPVNFSDPGGLRWREKCVGAGSPSDSCSIFWVEDNLEAAALLGGGGGGVGGPSFFFGGGGGGDSGNKDNCTAAGKKELNNPTQGRFIAAHLRDATTVARQLGTTPANILGLSALESGWGIGNFASHNNFFGQHYPQPGSTGPFPTRSNVLGARFPSYGASAQAFARQYGAIIRGVTNPVQFASALQASGKFGVYPNGSPVPGYVVSTAATIRGVERAIDCIVSR